MYTLTQSMFIRGQAGDPLPSAFESLTSAGTSFRRGQLALVAAGPGTGKSAFVLTFALRSGVPTLYFSADSDSFTQTTRAVAIMTERSLTEAENLVRAEDRESIEGLFKGLPIRFNYSASPSLDNIETTMMAYEEVHGDFPALVVVDNVTNVRTGADDNDPFSGLEALMDYLHDMARSTGACVIGLHHVQGQYNDCNEPIPLSGIKGQITRVPEMVLTLHRVQEHYGLDSLRVSTVKQRGGKSDPSGMGWVGLEFDGSKMSIRDYERTDYAPGYAGG